MHVAVAIVVVVVLFVERYVGRWAGAGPADEPVLDVAAAVVAALRPNGKGVLQYRLSIMVWFGLQQSYVHLQFSVTVDLGSSPG